MPTVVSGETVKASSENPKIERVYTPTINKDDFK